MEEEPNPPPIGWTIGEAMAALLPDLLAAADGRPPPTWWMAGGAEYKADERARLRRAFARIMEAGQYAATGLMKGQEQLIAPALWRAATFGLGLPGERVPEDAFFAGGKNFEGVRVNRPAVEDSGNTPTAAGSRSADEGQVLGPGKVRWTACEAYTWVAFREARHHGDDYEFPKSEWSVDWKDRPSTDLSRAFVCIVTKKPWGPDKWGSQGRAHCLAWARALMRDTGKTAMCLNGLLADHHERHGRNQDKLRQAFRDVMVAAREGRLTVWARPALGPSVSNVSAVHQALDPLLFEGPRAISVFGRVDYASYGTNEFDPRPENDFGFLDYKGPWFDEVRFDTEQVQALWPAPQPASDQAAGATIKATIVGRNRLQAWLAAEMRASPDVSPGKPVMRERATQALLGEGYTFSGESFLSAWANAIAETGAIAWSKAGAKPKSKGANRKGA